MPDRIPDDVTYLHEHQACPACGRTVAQLNRHLAEPDSRVATTIAFACACGYRLQWVCRCQECEGLPEAPDPQATELANALHEAHVMLEWLDAEGHTLPRRAYALIAHLRQLGGCCEVDLDEEEEP